MQACLVLQCENRVFLNVEMQTYRLKPQKRAQRIPKNMFFRTKGMYKVKGVFD